ncbi:RNA polymerase II-associated protein 1 C-terminal [Trinorchestia longiramus]|nr:RNA polymerase II-associated protein 1 C-terminal [Trinorchestia longiramus]
MTSKFASSRKKKARVEMVDHTVMQEAVSRTTLRCAVMGGIVERSVPSLEEWAKQDNVPWGPHQPLGNPRPPIIPFKKLQANSEKSFYRQYMESVNPAIAFDDVPQQMEVTPRQTKDSQDDPVGQGSAVVCGEGVLERGVEEAMEIHRENLERLSQLTPTEIQTEREQIMAQCDPKLLQFLQSRRHNKSQPADFTHPAALKEADAEGDNKDTSAPPAEAPEEEVAEADLPIPPSEAKKWLHMDKVELEKLKWTLPLPEVAAPRRKDQPYVARFSLTGDLMPYDADVSHREGLHHHGEEPERAGYTLDEIFVYARSSVVQQRQLALSILAAILNKVAQGYYFSCFQASLLQMLLDSGVVLLLRFSLDDAVAAVRQAVAAALAALLASDALEMPLSSLSPWGGILRPALASAMHAQQQVRAELQAEEAELKDAELLQLDVVRALVRVDTLVRVRYTLESLSPPPETVLHLLAVLTRIAAHSLTAAWEIVTCRGLLSCVVTRHLPHDTTALMAGPNTASVTALTGVPLRHVLVLLKVLCCWGPNISKEIVVKHNLMTKLLTFMSFEPTEVSLPLAEALKLSVTAHELFSVLLGFGVIEAQESFLSFYNLLVRHLYFYRDKVSINEDTGSNQLNFELGAHLFSTLRKAVSLAATKSMLDRQVKQHTGLRVGIDGEPGDVLQPPLISWDAVVLLSELSNTCCLKWSTQLLSAKPTYAGASLLGSSYLFAENYFRKCKDQLGVSAPEYLTSIESFFSKVVCPVLESPSLGELLSRLQSHSSLCSKLTMSSVEDAKNLSSLNCISLEGKYIPMLSSESPFPVLLPLSKLLLTLMELHPALPKEACISFLKNDHLLKYIEKLTNCSPLAFKSQWMTRVEVEFLSNILLISGLLPSLDCKKLLHSSALMVMTCLQNGQEHVGKRLLTGVICNSNCIADMHGLSSTVDALTLDDYEPLKSPALIQPCLRPSLLTSKIIDNIDGIGVSLAASLFDAKALKESVVWFKEIPFLLNSVVVPCSDSPNILDDYWPLLPLKRKILEKIIKTTLANEEAKKNPGKKSTLSPGDESDQSAPEDIVEVTRCLQLTYSCLRHRRNLILRTTCVTGWLRHLSLVMLIANDLFLDHNISSYLQGCLRELLINGGHRFFDDKLELPGLGNTFDWYKKMIEQYTAVSYGDYTYALMLLLPTLQCYPVAFRALLWGDLSDALPLIRLKSSDISTFIPIEDFLNPADKDEEMLDKYRSSLVTGMVTETRTPFLWMVATHHIRAAELRAVNKPSV